MSKVLLKSLNTLIAFSSEEKTKLLFIFPQYKGFTPNLSLAKKSFCFKLSYIANEKIPFISFKVFSNPNRLKYSNSNSVSLLD